MCVPIVPLGSVRNLQVTDPSVSTLNVRWEPAEGSVRQYRIYYQTVTGGAEDMVRPMAPPNTYIMFRVNLTHVFELSEILVTLECFSWNCVTTSHLSHKLRRTEVLWKVCSKFLITIVMLADQFEFLTWLKAGISTQFNAFCYVSFSTTI